MISKKMEKALNEQINKELYSAYLYLAMSAQAEENSLKGFANWFRIQFGEEQIHALKFFDYIVEQGGRVELAAIKQPPVEYKSPLAMFETTLKHEKTVTQSIYDLVNLAIREGDHATHSLLKWFVDEQVEEEANAQDIVNRLKMIGPSGSGMLYLDKELKKRSSGGE